MDDMVEPPEGPTTPGQGGFTVGPRTGDSLGPSSPRTPPASPPTASPTPPAGAAGPLNPTTPTPPTIGAPGSPAAEGAPGGTAGTLPTYGTGDPSQTTGTVSKGGLAGRGPVLAAVALVLVGAVFVVTNLTASDGAGSPEAAVDQMLGSVADEDLIGLLESISPGERRAMQPGIESMTSELERLEIIDPIDLEALPGFDLEIEGYTLTVEQLSDHLANVEINDGTISATSEPDEVPIGPALEDLFEDELALDIDIDPETASGELDGVRLTTVKVGGGWYVSGGYTLAETIRQDEGAPVPDFSQAVTPVGGDTPGGAIEGMVEAAVDLDLAGVIGHLPPDEMAPLYDYAPLFLDEADEAAAEVKESGEWTIDFSDLTFSESGSGDTRRVTVETFHLEIADEWSEVVMDFDGECALVESTYTDTWYDEPETYTTTVEACADGSIEYTDSYEDEYGYDDDYYGTMEDAYADLPSVFSEQMALTLTVVQVDGRWYVSPTRSLFDLANEALMRLDRSDIDALGEWFDSFSYSYDEQFEEIGCAVGSEGVIDDYCPPTTFDDENPFGEDPFDDFEPIEYPDQICWDKASRVYDTLADDVPYERQDFLYDQAYQECAAGLVAKGTLDPEDVPKPIWEWDDCYAPYLALSAEATEEEWVAADEAVRSCANPDQACWDASDAVFEDANSSTAPYYRLQYLADLAYITCAEALITDGTLAPDDHYSPWTWDEWGACYEPYGALDPETATEAQWSEADPLVEECIDGISDQPLGRDDDGLDDPDATLDDLDDLETRLEEIEELMESLEASMEVCFSTHLEPSGAFTGIDALDGMETAASTPRELRPAMVAFLGCLSEPVDTAGCVDLLPSEPATASDEEYDDAMNAFSECFSAAYDF